MILEVSEIFFRDRLLQLWVLLVSLYFLKKIELVFVILGVPDQARRYRRKLRVRAFEQVGYQTVRIWFGTFQLSNVFVFRESVFLRPFR